MTPSPTMRIGIDMGGTKIEAVALGPGGEVLARERVATPRTYEGSMDAIRRLVADLEARLHRRGTVGLGIPGTVSPATGLVKNANSTWLMGHPLDHDLTEVLGRPVRLMNDANCFALSEAVDGAAAGAHVVFGVILGTGVGGGIVVDRRPLVGHQLIAGEWGHNPLPGPTDSERPGPDCYCGRQGCIETFLSGPGMAADHLRVTGEHYDTHQIVRLFEAGEPSARATVARYVERLARSLASVINILDPDVIVLGGGMSHVPTLVSGVEAMLPRHVFTDDVTTRIVLNQHGDSSGVRGAAWLWPADAQATTGENAGP